MRSRRKKGKTCKGGVKGRLTHVGARGEARMVDIASKRPSLRYARAGASVLMKSETLSLILGQGIPKGDVLATARIAGISAAKRTPDLIPLCHPISLTSVEVDFRFPGDEGGKARIDVIAVARAVDRTGAEMEAMVAVSVAALAIYDMCKAVDRGIEITRLRLLEKSGGKSGTYRAEGETPSTLAGEGKGEGEVPSPQRRRGEG